MYSLGASRNARQAGRTRQVYIKQDLTRSYRLPGCQHVVPAESLPGHIRLAVPLRKGSSTRSHRACKERQERVGTVQRWPLHHQRKSSQQHVSSFSYVRLTTSDLLVTPCTNWMESFRNHWSQAVNTLINWFEGTSSTYPPLLPSECLFVTLGCIFGIDKYVANLASILILDYKTGDSRGYSSSRQEYLATLTAQIRESELNLSTTAEVSYSWSAATSGYMEPSASIKPTKFPHPAPCQVSCKVEGGTGEIADLHGQERGIKICLDFVVIFYSFLQPWFRCNNPCRHS